MFKHPTDGHRDTPPGGRRRSDLPSTSSVIASKTDKTPTSAQTKRSLPMAGPSPTEPQTTSQATAGLKTAIIGAKMAGTPMPGPSASEPSTPQHENSKNAAPTPSGSLSEPICSFKPSQEPSSPRDITGDNGIAPKITPFTMLLPNNPGSHPQAPKFVESHTSQIVHVPETSDQHVAENLAGDYEPRLDECLWDETGTAESIRKRKSLDKTVAARKSTKLVATVNLDYETANDDAKVLIMFAKSAKGGLESRFEVTCDESKS